MSSTTYSLLGKGLKLDTAEHIKPYCEEIEKIENLEIIILSGNTLGVEACKALGEALKSKKTLKVLSLSDIFTGRLLDEIPPSLTYICDAVMDHPNLVELDLSDNAFGPAGAKPLIPFLSYHTQLETLKLNNNGLGVFGATHIAEALIAAGQKNEKEGKKSNLKTIIIGRNRLENGSSEVMAKAIGYHKESLETVRMIQNGIRPEGIANLMGGLSQCPNLIHLDLQDNTFTTSGSKALAKALPSWPKLQILNVGDCMLEPKGGLEVLNTLKANPPKDLETLQLQYDELRIDSAHIILELIPLIPNLKSLELNGNQFPEDSDIVEKIKEALDDEDILGSLSDMEELSDEEEDEDEDDDEVDELAEDLEKVRI